VTAVLLALLAATSSAPRVAVVVHTTGFSDDDGKRVQDKVGAEVSATGVELWALSKSLDVRTECLVDRNCAREVLRAADAAWLVWIEATRAGGQVALESHLLDSDGRSVAQDESAARADEVTCNGALLSPVIVGGLRQAAVSAAKSAATTSPATATPPPTPTTAPLAADNKPKDAKADDGAKPEVSPLAIGGVAALGAGVLLVIGGGALTAQQLNVINTASSPGADKTNAATAATAMMVVAGVGVGAAVAGGVLLYLGL
jgi:hypothetical protein